MQRIGNVCIDGSSLLDHTLLRGADCARAPSRDLQGRMNSLTKPGGRLLARYLNQPSRDYHPFSISRPGLLRKTLQPGDVLLVEGDRRISVAIKYLTQSTWSHAALYVGHEISGDIWSELVEADLENGVIAVPLDKYEALNTRVCRPIGLTEKDRERVLRYMIDRIGMAYDLKNVIDLMRYLLPTPPVPVRWRRRMIALGSGDPSRAICSTLIAQAFQSINYPILPTVEIERIQGWHPHDQIEREILHIRHHSLFTPRDFDVSPYFQVIKPTIDEGFDYQALLWSTRADEA